VSEVQLKLFVAGDSPRSRGAAESLTRACADLFGDGVRIETVDILVDTAAADEYRVLTTPTVLRIAPAPRRRVTGDLRDIAQVLEALDLHAIPSP
jgi:circadian clock protein KaiB